jgi:hypothetical protein
MIADLGSLTLATIVPAAATASFIAAADANAQLDAMLDFQPVANLSYSAQLSLLTSMTANVQAAIDAGLSPPSLSAQVTAGATLSATINANLAIVAAIQTALLAGSVRLLTYSGQQDDFGDELDAHLGAPTTSVNALVLLTSNGASWTAMQELFKTS